jgi:hypothetical protein|tara:strand:- start:59 stop:415 length:357 start_codon:yes stop_codon:yes gene_type:complete
MKIDRKYLKGLIQEQINELSSAQREAEGAFGADKEASLADTKSLGSATMTKAQHAKAELEKSKGIQKGDVAAQVTNKERAILQDIEKLLTAIAEKDDLIKYKGTLQQVVNILRKRAGV